MTAAFLLSERPVTPEFLLSEGFKENESQQFAKNTVWSKIVTRGLFMKSSRKLQSTVHVEHVKDGDWRCSVSGLELHVHNCQDVLDIVSVLEK